MYEIGVDVNEELLYQYLTEKQIMEYYLGIPVQFSRLVKIPSFIRIDKKPTGAFYIDSAGRLVFKDFGGKFHGNYISVVMKKFDLSYRDAITRIYNELIEGKEIPIIPEEERVKYEPIQRKLFEVKRRAFNESDLAYWLQFGITKETLDLYKVSALQILWINKKIVYAYNQYDIGYLYDFTGSFKCYFPHRNDYRFLSNTDYTVLQGYDQLPKKGKTLIITKALKDVMVFRELGYDAIAPQAESVLISANQMIDLKRRFKRIISIMDFDYQGITLMNKMKRKYGISPYMLTNGRFGTPDYQAKDISDLVKLLGKEEVKKLIEQR